MHLEQRHEYPLACSGTGQQVDERDAKGSKRDGHSLWVKG